jgi:hypothetical protein
MVAASLIMQKHKGHLVFEIFYIKKYNEGETKCWCRPDDEDDGDHR